MLRQLLNDENGFILSAELVLVLTIGILAMIVGLTEFATATITELNDLSDAFGALNQSFGITGFRAQGFGGKFKGFTQGGGNGRSLTQFGSTFIDEVDDCDLLTSGDIIAGASLGAVGE